MAIFNFFNKEKSGAAAKDRLKLVLIHDRTMISPDTFESLKKEIIDVLSKYVEIDKEALNIELSREVEVGRETALIANIPLKIKTLP